MKPPKGVDPLTGWAATCRFRGVFRRARVVGSAIKADSDKPVAVFLGKARLGDPESAGVRSRIAIHDRYIRSVWVKTGQVRAERLGDCVHIALPALRPPALGGLLFYSVGPLIAVIAAMRRSPSAIVCQSPLEGLGAVLAVRVLPRSRRIPVQIELHGDWRAAPRLYGSRARHLVAPLSDRLCIWALRRADRVHVVSEAMAAQARRAGYCGPMDMHVEFADYSPFLEDDAIPFGAQPRVVFVGVLAFTKGVDVLLDAWPNVLAQVPRAALVIAGDGAMDAALRRRVSRLGLSRSVEFVGHVPPARLRLILDDSWCLVLPSRSEGLPRVVLEAMGRGRPVIASAVGGLPEMVDEGTTGHLVPAGRPEPLARAIVSLLHDPERAAKMGAEGRARVTERDPLVEYESGIERLAEWINA
jgi:glycosyltransferase involved in cell wall biosynthesis